MGGLLGYLLDTNVVLSLLRANSLGRSIDETHGLQRFLGQHFVSVVTVGEMLSLARQLGWGKERTADLERLLGQLVRIDINEPSILDAYPQIDHAILDAYPQINHASRKLGRPLGENDTWIAATARATGATLLTTDKDFDHLNGVWIDHVWIDPNTGRSL